jgi:hypothetical protein
LTQIRDVLNHSFEREIRPHSTLDSLPMLERSLWRGLLVLLLDAGTLLLLSHWLDGLVLDGAAEGEPGQPQAAGP